MEKVRREGGQLKDKYVVTSLISFRLFEKLSHLTAYVVDLNKCKFMLLFIGNRICHTIYSSPVDLRLYSFFF